MSLHTITRIELAEAMAKHASISRYQATDVLEEILKSLSAGIIKHKGAKISSFGTFIVHNKEERVGRNPKTGEEVSITPRNALSFRASTLLKTCVAGKKK